MFRTFGTFSLLSNSRPSPGVLYCTDTYPPQVNGVSVVTALAVSGLRERGWRVAVVAPTYPSNPATGVRHFVNEFGTADFHVDIPSLPFPPYPDIRLAAPFYWQVADAIKAFRPDLAHCATEFMIGRLGEVAAKRAGLPLVTSYHTDFARYTEAYGAPRLRKAVSNYIARFHGRALRTYTPSHAARADLLELGIQDVEVWGRTVDTKVFSPQRCDPLIRLLHGWEKQVRAAARRTACRRVESTNPRGLGIARNLLPAGSLHLVTPAVGRKTSAARGGTAGRHVPRRARHKRALPQLMPAPMPRAHLSHRDPRPRRPRGDGKSGLPVIATPAGGAPTTPAERTDSPTLRDVAGMAHAMVRLVMNPELRDGAAPVLVAPPKDWTGKVSRLA